MTASSATLWEGPSGTVPVVNANGNIFEEVQVAAGGQTLFTLASFQYTPGQKSIWVLRKTAADAGVGSEMLRRAVDYTETSSTKITLAAGAVAGDILIFIGFGVNQLIAPVVTNGIPQGGTAGQVLTKQSGSDYDASWVPASSIGALLDAARVNVASASTVNLATLETTTRNVQITGTTQIDGFQITNGQVWALNFSGALVLKNNASIITNTGADIHITPGTTCFVRAVATNIVEVLALNRGQKYQLVDRAYAEYTTWGAIATLIPFDDTIPQNTEGTQILSVTISPKNVNNIFRIRAHVEASAAAGASNFVAAVFKTGSTDAIRATSVTTGGANFTGIVQLEVEFVPGVTTPVTISLRVGTQANPITLNGTPANRLFGGSAAATLVVEEFNG